MNQYSLEVCVADAKRRKISIGLSFNLEWLRKSREIF